MATYLREYKTLLWVCKVLEVLLWIGLVLAGIIGLVIMGIGIAKWGPIVIPIVIVFWAIALIWFFLCKAIIQVFICIRDIAYNSWRSTNCLMDK